MQIKSLTRNLLFIERSQLKEDNIITFSSFSSKSIKICLGHLYIYEYDHPLGTFVIQSTPGG